MERAISEILNKWFEQKQKGKDSPVTYRERIGECVIYVVGRDDLHEFMDFIEYNLPFVMSIKCYIEGDSICFDTTDLKESPTLK